uniref:Uncharacterized protein n=1 Tax=Arion vulgaris TaxID=1028688 RepID=A0A0B7AD40_9EUPU
MIKGRSCVQVEPVKEPLADENREEQAGKPLTWQNSLEKFEFLQNIFPNF